MFLALVLAGQGSNDASPLLWFGALAALWASAQLMPTRGESGTTALGICVAVLAVWMTATNFFANPSYTVVAPYHAALLFGGYLFGRRAAAERGLVYGTAVAFAVVLAGWAISQQLAHVEQRAHGVLVTPATLASVINLVLAPGLVLILLGERRPAFIAPLAILCAVLAATLSRGGWLALLAACALGLLLIHRARLRPQTRGVAIVGGMLLFGAAAAWLINEPLHVPQLGGSGETLSGASFRARLELYALALSGINPATLAYGAGYHAFYYLLETGRDAVPSYAGSMTYFVHDDYLQVLLELGLPGLASLLFLVASPLAQAWRRLPRLNPGEQVALIAILAALTSMAVHALGDFPFYIPLCALIYGAALGMFDAILRAARNQGTAVPTAPARPSAFRRAAVAGAATVAFWILALPVTAESAAIYARKQWQAGDGQSAAYWFEAARRLDSRDWRYHWYAGQFWTAQARGQSDPAAARLADAAYSASVAANSRDVRPLYGRILLHSMLGKLLPNPADAATLQEWSRHAVELAPTDAVMRAERERILRAHPLGRP